MEARVKGGGGPGVRREGAEMELGEPGLCALQSLRVCAPASGPVHWSLRPCALGGLCRCALPPLLRIPQTWQRGPACSRAAQLVAQIQPLG